MNTIVNWNPWHELENMQDRILRAMQHKQANPSSSEGRTGADVLQWTPTLDISEDNHEYLIKLEIPEVSKDDIHVTVDGGMLTVEGERRLENEESDRKYHRLERSYGRFSRSLALPDDVDPDQVQAEFKNGLLLVHLEKNEAKKPRKIEVLVN